MSPKKFSGDQSEIDNKYADEMNRCKKGSKKHNWIAAVVCLALIVAAVVSVIDWAQNQIKLSDRSSNVTVRYISTPSFMQSSSQLVELTEEELFTSCNTVIFRGRILNISNIEISFNGDKDYGAIAEIEVETVYRGSCDIGDTVSVLLPCPIMEDYWVEDTGTVSVMQAGMTGIFMPMIYTDTSMHLQNGVKLALKDIADYGFGDGERFAFLVTKNGLVFDRRSYSLVKSIQHPWQEKAVCD